MKEPKSKLPWKLAGEQDNYYHADHNMWYSNTDPNNILTSETNEEVLAASEWLNIDKDDAEYIVQAANNFPEAVRLLKDCLLELDYQDVRLCNSINQFLTKLEEDEK